MASTRRTIARAAATACAVGVAFAVALPALVMGTGRYPVGAAPLPHGTHTRPDLAQLVEHHEPRSWIVTGVRQEVGAPSEPGRMLLAARHAQGAEPRPGDWQPPDEFMVQRFFGFPLRAMGYTVTWLRDGTVTTEGAVIVSDLGAADARSAPLRAWPTSVRVLPLLANFGVPFVPVFAAACVRCGIVPPLRRPRARYPVCRAGVR